MSAAARSSRRRPGVRRTDRMMPPLMPRVHAHQHVLEARHRREQADVLERAPDAEVRDRVRRQAGDVAAVEQDLAGRRRVDARQHVEERGLAGAVGADQADDRPARDDEVDVVARHQAAELLAHAPSPRAGCRPSRARVVERAAVDAELELGPAALAGDQALGPKQHHHHDDQAEDAVGVLRHVEGACRRCC